MGKYRVEVTEEVVYAFEVDADTEDEMRDIAYAEITENGERDKLCVRVQERSVTWFEEIP